MRHRKRTAVFVLGAAAVLFAAAPSTKTAGLCEYYFFQTDEGQAPPMGHAVFEADGKTLFEAMADFYKQPFLTELDSEKEAEIELFSVEEPQEGLLAYANVQDYVNIRKGPSVDTERVGKLYAGSVAEVLKEKGDWVLVSSGSVTGYIKSEFLLFGEAAAEALSACGRQSAVITCNVLNVRAGAGTDYSVLTQLTRGAVCEVLEEGSEWLKVYVNGEAGYIAKEYTTLSAGVFYALSMAEDAARTEKIQAADRRTAKEREAVEAARREKAAKEAAEREEARKAALGKQIADYAVKFVGNPYVWGGTSLTNGADCSGFVYAVYKQFGYTLVRSSREQAACASYRSVTPDTATLRAGDLVFYATGGVVDHVALYIGNGKVVQASTPKDGIIITRYNYRTPYSAKRVIY